MMVAIVFSDFISFLVDFVLRDPHQVEVKRSSSTKQLPHRQE